MNIFTDDPIFTDPFMEENRIRPQEEEGFCKYCNEPVLDTDDYEQEWHDTDMFGNHIWNFWHKGCKK